MISQRSLTGAIFFGLSWNVSLPNVILLFLLICPPPPEIPYLLLLPLKLYSKAFSLGKLLHFGFLWLEHCSPSIKAIPLLMVLSSSGHRATHKIGQSLHLPGSTWWFASNFKHLDCERVMLTNKWNDLFISWRPWNPTLKVVVGIFLEGGRLLIALLMVTFNLEICKNPL